MKTISVSFIGYGNLAYRMSIAMKTAGIEIPFICGRNMEEASKLSNILNKQEYAVGTYIKTNCTADPADISDSDAIILAVSDNVISDYASTLMEKTAGVDDGRVCILHCSGASDISIINEIPNHGVLYPLMTLSRMKPVDIKSVPFFLESSGEKSNELLVGLCELLGSNYRFSTSEERLRLHVAAVYVSNFVNYLIGLAYDLSAPDQILLMPLAIETVCKAFLYGHPDFVQTGPAIRGDTETTKKHLALLESMPEHKMIYEIISEQIKNRVRER